MKSYINTLADYREAPFEKNVTIICPKEYVESQLKHLTRNYKKTEAVDVVENGDVAVLSVESELKKFNRSMLPLTVGKNLFDEEFEAQLVGHSVGGEFSVKVQNKNVDVTIKQASRTVFPRPTDEMALEYAKESEEFADIKTVDDYCNQIIDKYIDDERSQAVYNAMDEVVNYVLTHSDWEFDDSEIKEQKDIALEEVKEILKEDSKELESLTEEELDARFGVSSLDEFDEMLTSSIEQSIASELWLMAVNNTDNIEEFEGNPYEFLQEYVESNLNITEEK